METLTYFKRGLNRCRPFATPGATDAASYLTYLRDRLTAARDFSTETASIFVQIGDENVHRVRALMDEVFGERNLFH